MSRLAGSIVRSFCAPQSRKQRTRRPRLSVGTLEDRTVPAIFTVTTTAGDTSPGSLGAAILQANATPEADQIVFDTTGTFATAQTITLTGSLPTITLDGGGLTITGPGRDNLTLDGASAFQVLNSNAPTLTLSGFTITHGDSATSGGGVQASGFLTLTGMAITNSSAVDFGGGVNMLAAGNLEVQNSLISGNTAGIAGAGVAFRYGGSLLMNDSTVANNTAVATIPYYGGGGIGFYGWANAYPPTGFTANTLVIQNSTIANNNAGPGGSGGGVLLIDAFARNGSLQFIPVTLELQNTTVTGNSANGGLGGGIANQTYPPTAPNYTIITLQNSIVAGNTSASAPDVSSANTVNANFSAIGNASGFTLSGTSGNNVASGTPLLLGPLTDDGGELPTVAPQTGSPLINAGSNALVPAALTTDERGFPFVRTNNSTVDIGAFETQPDGIPFATATPTPLKTAGGTSYTFQVTFADTSGSNRGIQVGTVTAAAIQVKDGSGNVVPAILLSAVPNADGSKVVATYSIPAAGGTWDVGDDAVYTLTAVANQVKDLDSNFVPTGTLGPIDIFIPRTLVVTSTADSGTGTLRAALTAAAFGSDDTITFDPSVFSTPQVINLESALPGLGATTGNLTIDGPGASLLTVERDPSASTQFRVLATQVPNLTLSNFTLSGGTITAAGDATLGNTGTGSFGAVLDHMVITGNNANGSNAFAGGLYIDRYVTAVLENSQVTQNTSATNEGGVEVQVGALLTVENSTISNNSATAGIGGGIVVSIDATLNLIDSTVSNNSATSVGAGLFADIDSTVNIIGSTISGNTAGSFGGALFANPGANVSIVNSTISGNAGTAGGGIFFAYGGSLSVTGSTISGNSATATSTSSANGGGGIYFYGAPNFGSQAPVTITNSTIADNQSATTGGGILLNIFGGPSNRHRELLLSNTTVTGNSASGSAGGGIYSNNAVYTSNIVLQNSIVAGNTNTAAPDIKTTGPVTAQFSAIGSTTGMTGSNSLDAVSTGLVGANLLLGPLQDNGGPTQTVAPKAGSPLIDAGSNALVAAGITTDQRGFNRTFPGGGTVDIGSVEAQPAIPTITVDPAQANPTNDNTQVTFDVTFNQPVSGFDPSQIDLTASTATGTLTADVTQVDATHYTVTVTGITGDGTVVASVLAGTGSEGLNGSGENNVASAASASVTVDTTPPTVTVNQDGLQKDPTNANPIVFDVQFSEAVIGFNAGDVTLGGTLAGVATVTSVTPEAGNLYLVNVTISGSQTGTITASVGAGLVTDAAGNSNTASTSSDNTVTFDNQPPTVTVTPEAGQGATVGGTAVVFDVTFSEAVQGFNTGAVDLTGTTALGATANVTDSGDHTHFTVTVNGMTAGGTIDLTVDNGAVQDPAGNDNVGSNTGSVTYEHSGTVQFATPTYSINEQGAPVLDVVVNRVGGSDGSLVVNYATADGTALAGTDYTAESGTLSWAAGDSTSQTIAIPILDSGGLKADTDFTVGLSNISLPGALGSPATATVEIIEEGGLSFSAANYPVDESVGNAVVIVHREFNSTGAVTVAYATSDGTATAGSDYTTETGTLSWADGDNTDRTILVPIVNDTVSEGKETINLTLSDATGNALIGPQGTATITIAASDGVTLTAGSKTNKATFSEDGTPTGDQVTISLGGKVGTLTHYLTNGNGPISEIDLSGTDATSTVTITVKKPRGGTGDGRIGIGEVDGTGFKTFTARTGDLDGAGFNLTGYAGTITVGNVSNGADFLLPGALPAKLKGVAITAAVIGDGTDIDVAAPLKSLTAIAVGQGTITAPSVGTIHVKGQKATKTVAGVSGDFKDDVTISGVGIDPVKGKALTSLNVAGAVSGATISVGGNVGTVSVGSFNNNSDLLVGYNGPVIGGVASDFTGAFSIGSFVTHAKADSFADSYVIATSIKAVTLATVDTDNGGVPFGFEFQKTSLNGKSFGGVGRLSAKDDQGDKLSYNTKTGGTQPLKGDFGVEQL
jgi:hypothetical protein